MKLSVIIPTKDRAHFLKGCLRAILKNKNAIEELIIVDQSADNKTREILESLNLFNYFKVIYQKAEIPGVSRAKNIGIQLSSGDIIAFTDDDCLVEESWAENILNEFSYKPSLKALFGAILPIIPDGIKRKKLLGLQRKQERRIYQKPTSPWNFQSGGNAAFRREVFDRIGPFDELLGPGAMFEACEDVDIAYRLLKHSQETLYSPLVRVYHIQWRSEKEAWSVERNYNIGAGAIFAKYLRCRDLYIVKLICERFLIGIANLSWGGLTLDYYRVYKGFYFSFYPLLGLRLGLKTPLSFPEYPIYH